MVVHSIVSNKLMVFLLLNRVIDVREQIQTTYRGRLKPVSQIRILTQEMRIR